MANSMGGMSGETSRRIQSGHETQKFLAHGDAHDAMVKRDGGVLAEDCSDWIGSKVGPGRQG
jgi:hypothetical protein